MKQNHCIILAASVFIVNMQGCSTQPNPDPSHQEPIVIMDNKQSLVDELEQIIALVNHEFDQNNWDQANIHLKKGLDILGNRYSRPITPDMKVVILDDTGMALVAAYDLEKKGLIEKSARLRLGILQERLDQFKANP